MTEILTDKLPSWALDSVFLFPTWKWLAIVFAVILGLILKKTAKFFLGFFIQVTDKDRFRLQHQILTCLERPTGLVIASAFWFLALRILQLDGTMLKISMAIVQMSFSISLVWASYNLMDVVNVLLTRWAEKTKNTLDDQLVPMVYKCLKIFIVIFGSLVSLQNLGINVMSVLAGLGLGGLAFALAAKDTCANLFGSIMILLDRPFMVGDWVVVGELEGTVEKIGFRSTRIRTFYDSIISIPNANVANANIDNMGQRKFRRVRTTLGVTYDTPAEKLEAFMEGIKNVILANAFTRKDYFHVAFSGYSSSSLDIMLYYFLEVPGWSEELVERQNVYLEILRLAKEIDVDFAFSTQTLHIESFPEKKPLREAKPLRTDILKEVPKNFGPNGSAAKPEGTGFFTPPYKDRLT